MKFKQPLFKQFTINGASHYQRKALVIKAIKQQAPPKYETYMRIIQGFLFRKYKKELNLTVPLLFHS